MSKICNRVYSENSMLATKVISGVDCCPICIKPAICHGKSIEQRALYWALSDNTGTSSKTLCRFMLGFPQKNPMPPSDRDDRLRCIMLLELIPEWLLRLGELAKTKPIEMSVIGSTGITTQVTGWADQIPLIIKEGGF